jgi:hypothetical protein
MKQEIAGILIPALISPPIAHVANFMKSRRLILFSSVMYSSSFGENLSGRQRDYRARKNYYYIEDGACRLTK